MERFLPLGVHRKAIGRLCELKAGLAAVAAGPQMSSKHLRVHSHALQHNCVAHVAYET